MRTHNRILKACHYTIVLLCCSYPVAAQIDYVAHPDFISAAKRKLTIHWINTSPEKCLIDLNHFVEFHNVKGDVLSASKVQVVLYKNENPVRSYLFATGGGILNRIHVPEPVPLKKGDALYFVFTLLPETENEEYVFNIFQKKQGPGTLQRTGEQKLFTYSTPQHHEQQDVPQQTKNAVLTPVRKQEPAREKSGDALKQQVRRERFNRTMTSLVDLFEFLL